MEFQSSRSDDFDYDNIAMDTSVLGDQTMASLEEKKAQMSQIPPQIPPSYHNTTQPAPYAYNPDADSTGNDDRPTEELAYGSDTDDVSTLANDTVSGRQSITKLFPLIAIKTKSGEAQRSGPANSLNYQGYSNDDGDDEGLKRDIVDEKSSFKKLKYFIAAAFGLFLIGSSTALTLGFLNLKDEKESVESSQRAFDEDQIVGDQLVGDWEDWTFKPTQAGSSPPTVSGSPSFTPTTASPSSTPSTSVPSSSPSTSSPSFFSSMAPTGTVPTTSAPTSVPSRSPSIAPTGNPTRKPTGMPSRTPSVMPSMAPSPSPTQSPTTSQPTQSPTTSAPTMKPTTAPPTQAPTPAPTMTKEEKFQTVLGGASPDVLVDIERSGSPQKEVYDWLLSDPDFYSYSEDRLIQRYALGVFSLQTSDNRRRRLALDYSNECNWFPPADGSAACNREGIRENIVLRNQKVDGTLPTEIYMLEKLKTLILPNSMLFGMLPDSITGMKSLRVLDLSNNRLSGNLPEQIGDLKKLNILDLSNNAFNGELPKNIGRLKDVKQVNLSRNLFEGAIPADIRKMKNLESLDVQSNRLSGSIPLEMTEMVKLQQLQLTDNFLTGVVEASFCQPLVDLTIFTTDCQAGGSITCNCCTFCGSGVSQASVVSQGISIQIAEADSPKLRGSTPQSLTSGEANVCENKVDAIKTCYESGSDIRVHITNCDAEGTDWIGLYDSNADPEKLGEPLLWLKTCGRQDCGVTTRHGSVYFDETAASGSSWPIAEGSYKAFLVRNGSHKSFAESGEILVQEKC
ncbi:unnamed protein product [Cylindrotheca closterium]|uniref:non-specific serine/threonine protein kinase n=1 Tax=Cylindrotheca closterium TaxID=2856 RepID=A0AAD2CUN5_9STRA|nr:unnamed protein product [Cylindrotheca closterium]